MLRPAAILSLFALPYVAAAHDIPSDVTVQAFLKPSGQRLDLLVRVPLKAMRDIEFPKRAPGYLDIDRSAAYLSDAAKLWIADAISVYEDDNRLPAPQVVNARVSLPSDRSFASYDTAMAHLAAPRLPNDTAIYWDQALLDVRFV